MEKEIKPPDFNKNSGKIKIISIMVFYSFVLSVFNTVYADSVSPEQIQRSQEILREDKMLREKVGQEVRVFVEKVVVKGADNLSEEEINNLALPYLKRWLKKTDIQEFLDELRKSYVKKSRNNSPFEISHQIKNSTLEVIISNLSK